MSLPSGLPYTPAPALPLHQALMSSDKPTAGLPMITLLDLRPLDLRPLDLHPLGLSLLDLPLHLPPQPKPLKSPLQHL